MRRAAYALLISAAFVSLVGPLVPPAAAQQLAQQEAEDIATDAYVYFYPLVTMDVTRRQLTNAPSGATSFSGPMNMFQNVPTYPKAGDKAVVRPNFDTLYSSAYLDLTKEPVVVSVPDTNGRYYLLPMLDMWRGRLRLAGLANDRHSGGGISSLRRRTGAPTSARSSLEELKLPDGTQRIDAPTPYVWVIGRTRNRWPSRLRCGQESSGRPQGHASVRVGQGCKGALRQ